MNTSIVIVACDNFKYIKLCIDSIIRFAENDSYEIVVVDNGSTDETVQYLKKQKDIIVVFNKEKTGINKAYKQGIMASKYENDILIISDDIIATPNWLENLKKCLYSSDDIGAVGAVTNCNFNFEVLKAKYRSINELIKFANINNISNRNRWKERFTLSGVCTLIRREVINKVGYLDEQFLSTIIINDDYCLRIRKAGYKLILCNDCYVHCFGNTVTKENKHNKIFEFDKNKLESKWKILYEDVFSFRIDLPQFIVEKFEKNFNFLHINCGCGGTLLYIKNIFKNASLYGIEEKNELMELKPNTIKLVQVFNNMLLCEKNLFDYIFIDKNNDFIHYIEIVKDYIKENGTIFIALSKNEYMNKKGVLNKKINTLYKNHNLIEYDEGINIVLRFDLYGGKNNVNVHLKNINCNHINKIDNKKEIDENKVAFIFCANDIYKVNTAINYIKQIKIPDKFKMEIIILENAKSITSAYNIALENTDAKYKVYLHQDAYILNKDFLLDMLNIFDSDENLGMLGCVGTDKLPQNGVWWEGKKYGKVFDSHTGKMALLNFNEFSGKYKEVEAVDGLIIITDKDVPWKEDIFDGWHFYDISQCIEFIKMGYKIGIVNQYTPWFIHDSGIANIKNGYEYYRLKFLKYRNS